MNLNALRNISCGVYVIGSRKDDRFNAQIANTVFQITSEPPTVAISINRKNLTHEFITASKTFTASMCCEDTPLPFIGHLGFKSGRDINKLEGLEYTVGVTGAPVVTQHAASYLETRVVSQLDVGTHTIFVGEMVNADVLNEKKCMTYDYYLKIKRGTTPVTAPTYIREKREVGA
ncbi:MAG: flavin reductase [Chloroflexi bacterium]|nr:flavin reductase [Chloroflexota bacterium]